jgi:hypothetical protein
MYEEMQPNQEKMNELLILKLSIYEFHLIILKLVFKHNIHLIELEIIIEKEFIEHLKLQAVLL